jgi:hypothetical protein
VITTIKNPITMIEKLNERKKTAQKRRFHKIATIRSFRFET